jgi:hypothetical protein
MVLASANRAVRIARIDVEAEVMILFLEAASGMDCTAAALQRAWRIGWFSQGWRLRLI